MKRIIILSIISHLFIPVFGMNSIDSIKHTLPTFVDSGKCYSITPNSRSDTLTIDDKTSLYIHNRLNSNIYDTAYYLFLLRIKINRKGKIDYIVFLKDINDSYVEDDIRRILKDMTFVPAKQNGKAIDFICDLAIVIDFRHF